MSLPPGFMETVQPFWVDDGREFARQDVRSDPDVPVFLRATIQILNPGGLPNLTLQAPPRSIVLGGPMRNASFSDAEAILRQWLFDESNRSGLTYWVQTERVPIAPPNFFGSSWPQRKRFWSFEYEQTPPIAFQLQTRGGRAGNPTGGWARVR